MVCVMLLCLSCSDDLFFFWFSAISHLQERAKHAIFRLCFVKQGIQPRENWAEVKRENDGEEAGERGQTVVLCAFFLSPLPYYFFI